MEFESLANETLLDLFEYLHVVHLLRAFHGLNKRFDNLLIHHFQLNSLDFYGISKSDFDIVCQQQLPSFTNHIHSLYYPNQDERRQKTEYLSFQNLPLSQFIHLQSLTLRGINYETMEKIYNDLCHLIHLTHLYMISCSFLLKHFDNILRLTKLTHCTLEYITLPSDCKLTVISSSLEHFTVRLPDNYDFKHLLEHMPHLQYLSILNETRILIKMPSFTFPSLKTLKLKMCYNNSTCELENLIEHLPNLYQLTVDLEKDFYVNGYQWKKIITQYIPKLQVFHLRMRFILSIHNTDADQRLNSILDSFRDSFWIEEHQWFIRCHYHHYNPAYYLYTLPYIFNKGEFFGLYDGFKSTCPNDNDYYIYSHVRELSAIYTSYVLSSKDFFYDRFRNLRKLETILSIDNDYIEIFPIFYRLKSLDIFVQTNDDILTRYQLQLLLNKSPNLVCLCIKSMIPTDITSKSVRQLKLRFIPPATEQICMEICNTPLGIQCEMLEINVNSQRCILYLINNMKNLRLLQFEYNDYPRKPTRDDLLKWFKEYLPSNCIVKDSYYGLYTIHIR